MQIESIGNLNSVAKSSTIYSTYIPFFQKISESDNVIKSTIDISNGNMFSLRSIFKMINNDKFNTFISGFLRNINGSIKPCIIIYNDNRDLFNKEKEAPRNSFINEIKNGVFKVDIVGRLYRKFLKGNKFNVKLSKLKKFTYDKSLPIYFSSGQTTKVEEWKLNKIKYANINFDESYIIEFEPNFSIDDIIKKFETISNATIINIIKDEFLNKITIVSIPNYNLMIGIWDNKETVDLHKIDKNKYFSYRNGLYGECKDFMDGDIIYPNENIFKLLNAVSK